MFLIRNRSRYIKDTKGSIVSKRREGIVERERVDEGEDKRGRNERFERDRRRNARKLHGGREGVEEEEE